MYIKAYVQIFLYKILVRVFFVLTSVRLIHIRNTLSISVPLTALLQPMK